MKSGRTAMIVLDLDGTLLNGRKEVSLRNLQAVQRCARQGMRIVMATARPPRSVRHLLPQELQEIADYVYYNGAWIHSNRNGIEEHYPVPQKTAEAILAFCSRYMPQAAVSVEVKDCWYASRDIANNSLQQTFIPPVVVGMEQLSAMTPTKLLLTGFNDAEPLLAAFRGQVNMTLTDQGQLLQVMRRDVSKGAGVLQLCRRLGVEPQEAVVFGDDYNDLDMFTIGAYSVAMGNAEEELKQAADEVALSNEEDGVAVVLERL